MGNTSRLLIAGTGSGCGKTMVVCGLLNGLLKRGRKPCAWKCGPDYIDGMFHSRVLGIPTGNLDSFLTQPEILQGLLMEKACDIRVIEGVMGYYDGCGPGQRGSSYEIAKVTDTPVLLVVNAKGMSTSALALVKGFVDWKKDSRIAGVIYNRLPAALYPSIKEATEAMGVRALGYIPPMKEIEFPSRRLGLVGAKEIADFKMDIDALTENMKTTLDWDTLMGIADRAGKRKKAMPGALPFFRGTGCAPRIAVARDEAFCFLYQDNVDLLKKLGCEIAYFSPLKDETLPERTSGLILSGGYPEIYAKTLEENDRMRAAVRRAAADQIPLIAECGGFMYLQKKILEGRGEKEYQMAGVLDGICYDTGKLSRFGYATLEAKHDSLLFRRGETWRAHEFHYYDSSEPGFDFTVQRASREESWEAGIATDTMYAGYPHLYLYGCPEAAERFVDATVKYQERKAGNHGR